MTFRELGQVQRQARIEASNYDFFIQKGFVNDVDELKKLYLWFDPGSKRKNTIKNT
jgi:hypothetical protein